MVRAPGINGVTLTPGTLQRAIFPPERVDVGLTLVDVEEVVDVREMEVEGSALLPFSSRFHSSSSPHRTGTFPHIRRSNSG